MVFLADDAEERVIEPVTHRGIEVVIPPQKNRKQSRHYDDILYKARHLRENFEAKLKQYGAIATRFDSTQVNLMGGIPTGSFSHLITGSRL